MKVGWRRRSHSWSSSQNKEGLSWWGAGPKECSEEVQGAWCSKVGLHTTATQVESESWHVAPWPQPEVTDE
jgi:hypothetical protein